MEKIYKYSNLPTKDLQKKMKCNIKEQQMAPKYYFFNCIGLHKWLTEAKGKNSLEVEF